MMDVTIIIHLWKEATHVTIKYPSSSPQSKAHHLALADFFFLKSWKMNHMKHFDRNMTHVHFSWGPNHLNPNLQGPQPPSSHPGLMTCQLIGQKVDPMPTCTNLDGGGAMGGRRFLRGEEMRWNWITQFFPHERGKWMKIGPYLL